jgi:ATP-dependent DNA helicase RecG
MKINELNKIIDSGETETVEFKESPADAFFKTLSAFANSKGGIVFLGIDKKAGIVGVDSSADFLTDLTNRIVDKLSLYPDIETIDIQGKRVLAVKIIRPGFPVSFQGRYYERIGNTTREMSPQKLQALLLSKSPWDSITGDFSFDEIDQDAVELFARLATDARRLTDLSLKDTARHILEKLEYISDGKLTSAAMLLFGKNPQKHFINHCVRVGRFKTETTIIDDKWARGNLFHQLDETLNILKQHIAVRYEIKTFQREDIWDYPIPALREAVVNSLVHRDYFDVANFTLIKVYDDHIWVTNPGGLPDGITLEELTKPHKSRLRNPLIARAFYLSGLIEQYGSGTVRMIDWMKEAGLPEPEYKEEQGGFSVYFYKDIYTEEKLKKMG